MDSLIIRDITSADYAKWHPLWTAYLTFYETELADDITQTTFARLCDPAHSDQNVLVAEQDGQLVGFAHYIFHAHNWHTAQVTYLQDLFVDPNQRGTGLGRALIEAIYRVADDSGRPSVYWTTQEFNHSARQLYDRVATLTPFIKYAR